jgi:DNA (cytosine-5)-methyltransferase 1
MPKPAQRYAAVSLFAGCGGMDLGAEQSARAKVVWAIDNDHWAVETYRRNLGRHIVEADITETPVPQVPCDILLAGPPCQDYSTLWNHDGLKTARGNLFRQVARFLDALRPAGFVLENVPGLLSANRGAAWTLVRHALRAPTSFAG